jgi:hypothetical protein
MPPLSPRLPGGMLGMPGMQGMPSMPSFPSASAAPQPPAPPSFAARPPRDVEKELDAKVDKVKDEYEKKLNEMSKRLQEEREKLLVTQLKSQEEEATSAKVEISLKELQDRLRRDRRDQEQEEAKLKLEKKAQELESRLAQERETWVVTLKNQLGARESQEKEVENHFAMRLQEMERRWLEEKANWQKIALAKDDEIRTLRSLAEKLKGADTELSKVASEKKMLEERCAELAKDRAEAHARLQNAGEREKESIQLRADLTLSRQSGAMVQERLERDLAGLRASAREREERLMADVERLQRDFANVKQRFDGEKEAELRRARIEYETDLSQHKQAAERATSELQRLRAVAGALERQAASGRAQLEELKRASADWERTQERYKAEFVVLQRKWIEREKEVRAEASSQSLQMLDAEKARLRVMAQDELNQRVAKIADQLRQENESEQRRLESKLRADLETELQARRQELLAESDGARVLADAEMGRLRRELAQKDAAWGERLLAKESETLTARGRADEAAGRLSRGEEARQAAERRGLELEKAVQDGREEAGRLSAALRETQKRLADGEMESARLEREKTEFERLASAQAAQIQGSQEALESARVQLAREAQLGKIAQSGKEQIEKALVSQRQELARALQAQKAEFERLAAERERTTREESARASAEAEAALRLRDDALRAAAASKDRAETEARALLSDERARLAVEFAQENERAKAEAVAEAQRLRVEAAADVERLRAEAAAEAVELRGELGSARAEVQRLARDADEGVRGAQARIQELEAKAAQQSARANELGAELDECRKEPWTKRLFKKRNA